ncbi:hypothetical protein FACS1894124_8740 [Spirochaetia bacterium]|nr:hypothetical protein FACS1894124_8740 [Spirochaetia bacterium]
MMKKINRPLHNRIFFGVFLIAALAFGTIGCPTSTDPAPTTPTPKPPKPDPEIIDKGKLENLEALIFDAVDLQDVNESADGYDVYDYDQWVPVGYIDKLIAAIEEAETVFYADDPTAEEITAAYEALEAFMDDFKANTLAGLLPEGGTYTKIPISGTISGVSSGTITIYKEQEKTTENTCPVNNVTVQLKFPNGGETTEGFNV